MLNRSGLEAVLKPLCLDLLKAFQRSVVITERVVYSAEVFLSTVRNIEPILSEARDLLLRPGEPSSVVTET
eukprot:1183961-Amphidinium_carterae.1